jgi:Tfp pilus assembly protein PilO
VVVLDWQYWYGPNQRDLADVTAQVAQKRADLDSKRGKTNARGELERELRDINAELKRAQARLPDQREIADLLSSVAASGRSSGLEIVLFRQKPRSTTTSTPTFPSRCRCGAPTRTSPSSSTA